MSALAPAPRQGGLPAWGRRVVRALAQAALPARGAQREPADVAERKLDQVLAEIPWHLRLALLGGLMMIEWSGVVFAGGRFTGLNDEKRLRVLDRWHHGPAALRLALRGLLTPIKVAYFADDQVAASLGYRPREWEAKPSALDALPPGDIRIGRTRKAEEVRCDVVVIGSGAGGAVVARELAAKGRKVVVVEEGQYWTRRQFTRRPFEMQRLMYRDQAFTVALGRGGIPIPLGMTVGGSTTINSGTCFRVPEHTLRRWRNEHGLSDMTADALAPFYERVERNIGVRPVPDPVLGQTAKLVAKGATALGLHPAPLRRNAIDCKGSGVCCFGCPEDAKRSMNVSYVPAALQDGAILYTDTRATRLLHNGRKASGVECQMGEGGERLLVHADAVVVSAGAIHTPVFLKGQGLGRRSEQLGRNLSIHPATKVAAFFDHEVRPFDGVPQGLYIHDLMDQGIVFEGASLTPDFTSVGLPFYGPRLMEAMERYLNLATFGIMVEDESQGEVLRSPDGRAVMLYQVGEAEIDRLKRGIEVLCRIFFRAGARTVLPPLAQLPELHREEDCEQIRDLRIEPEDLELTAFHPLGTCRMATDPFRGVIDPDLEAYELDRLFVADGSIFASSLGVNPQLTIMAFATRAASHIDARLAGSARRFRTW